jgi:hypothetical protein
MPKEPGEPQLEGEKQEPKRLFDLKDFLVEPKTDYTDLIEKAKKDWDESMKYAGLYDGAGLNASYADVMAYGLLVKPEEVIKNKKYIQKKEEVRAFLKDKLKGKILVDLGSGMGFIRGALMPESWGGKSSMQKIAQELNASVCIGVDKYTYNCECAIGKPTDPSVDLARKEEVEEGTQTVLVSADMLDFLSRLPDSSVCITINGVDSRVIKNEEYHRALAKEIERVVGKNGVVFGVNSSSLSIINRAIKDKPNEISFKIADCPELYSDAMVFEKRK